MAGMEVDVDQHEPMEIDYSSPQLLTHRNAYHIDNQWVPPPKLNEGYELYRDGEGLWVVHSWKPDARLEPFYQRWPPSRTHENMCAWIAIVRGPRPSSLSDQENQNQNNDNEQGQEDNSHHNAADEDVEGLIKEFNALVDRGDTEVTKELIDEMAKKYNVLSGKWLIYATSSRVDYLFRKVAKIVCFSRGYGQLKVSTVKNIPAAPPNPSSINTNSERQTSQRGSRRSQSNEGQHVICVYVENYLDMEDVDELRRLLRNEGGVRWKIGFKPDVYTHLGIYTGNRWNLRPSRYHDADTQMGM